MDLDNDDALTPGQKEYFETLARMDPSPEMQRIIRQSKRDLIRQNGYTPEYWKQRENYLRSKVLHKTPKQSRIRIWLSKLFGD